MLDDKELENPSQTPTPSRTWKFYAVAYAVLMVPLAACFGVTYQQDAYQKDSHRKIQALVEQGYLPRSSEQEIINRTIGRYSRLGDQPKYQTPQTSYSAPTFHPPTRSLSEPTYYRPSYTRDYDDYDTREKTVKVRPYYRKDGTFVRGHMRRPPRRR